MKKRIRAKFDPEPAWGEWRKSKWYVGMKPKRLKDNSIHISPIGGNGKTLCLNCLKKSKMCKCDDTKRNIIDISINARVPRANASKQTWKRFLRLYNINNNE